MLYEEQTKDYKITIKTVHICRSILLPDNMCLHFTDIMLTIH